MSYVEFDIQHHNIQFVLECHGRFILTNAAPSTSLMSAFGGSSGGSTTAYKQANKSNFVLCYPNSPYSGIEIGWRWFSWAKNLLRLPFLDWQAMSNLPYNCWPDLVPTSSCFDLDETIRLFLTDQKQIVFLYVSIFYKGVVSLSPNLLSDFGWIWSVIIKHNVLLWCKWKNFVFLKMGYQWT